MQPRFLHCSSALALGGRITRPFSDIVPVQASVALPITGGHGEAKVVDYQYRDLIACRRATSFVTGSDDATHYYSAATVVIEDLNLLGVVTADRVVARVTTATMTTC